MADKQYTVARVRNYLNVNGERVMKKIVLTTPNLDPIAVARELKKKARFKDVPAETLAKDIEIVGDESALKPAEKNLLGSMTEKEVRVAK